MQPESRGQYNFEPEPKEGAGHSDDKQRNEVGPPPTPSMSSQDDLLQNFETGMAQFLANMNVYMQPEEPLNINLGETQYPGNYAYTRILSS